MADWLALLLLFLAAFRIFRLIAEDTILDTPRNKLLRLSADWREETERLKRVNQEYVPPPEYRAKWAAFITCPWCLGFWVCGAVLGLYSWLIDWHGWFWFVITWLALSSLVGLTAKNLDKEEE